MARPFGWPVIEGWRSDATASISEKPCREEPQKKSPAAFYSYGKKEGPY